MIGEEGSGFNGKDGAKAQDKTDPQVHPTLAHVKRYLQSIRQPNQQHGIYDPITQSQYDYFKKTIPDLYKEDVCRAWFDFVQVGRGLGREEVVVDGNDGQSGQNDHQNDQNYCLGGDKIEELWNFHFISTPELPSLLQQIQSDAIDFRLGLYQYAEAMAHGGRGGSE